MPDWMETDVRVLRPIFGVYVVLTISTLATWWLQLRTTAQPATDKDVEPAETPAPYQELYDRIISWWLMVTIFAAALMIGGGVAIALFAFISFLALKEYLTLLPARECDRRVFFWAYLSIPLQYLVIYYQWYGMFAILVPVYFYIGLSIRAIITGQMHGFIRAVATIHWGVMLTVYCLGHLAYLHVLPGDKHPGAALVLYVVMLTQANDVFQFLWGKSLGRRKVAPTVSPGKTWAGFLGGTGTTVMAAMFVGPWMTPMSLAMAAASGAIMSVGGFFGDLLLSSVKRDLQIKDTGSLLPGHGGILDRVDSLTIASPLMLHFLRYFYFA